MANQISGSTGVLLIGEVIHGRHHVLDGDANVGVALFAPCNVFERDVGCANAEDSASSTVLRTHEWHFFPNVLCSNGTLIVPNQI